ncbi:hypothetical protein [Mucilaginibacter hurinus]|uniref:hypothetical protein n=1 Tax=Mucilaginibacter hurinus TaxID=2201324 RepID=UPI0018F3A3AB|nr:hypothetical protein [Mucilaginibacter hurinus]
MKGRCSDSPYRFVFIPLGIAALLALVSFIVMQLWNHLLPAILGITAITFWQAMGIFILCKILFGFGRGPGGAPWMRHRRMKEHMKNMSDEERERFKAEMKSRMCRWGNPRHDNISLENDNPTGTEQI